MPPTSCSLQEMWCTGGFIMGTFDSGTYCKVVLDHLSKRKSLNLKKSLPPLSTIFSWSWLVIKNKRVFHFFPFHLHLFFNFQRIIGCRRVISIRLTSCELTNWCFGPTTTPAVDFGIICAAQIHTRERLKRLVSIWLSLKLQWIQLQPQKKKKNGGGG